MIGYIAQNISTEGEKELLCILAVGDGGRCDWRSCGIIATLNINASALLIILRRSLVYYLRVLQMFEWASDS